MTTFIKYGIDLGTTNSSIARLNNSQVQVIKDLDFNSEVVPSCVVVTPKLMVGDRAATKISNINIENLRIGTDKVIGAVEFKRTMGTETIYPFHGQTSPWSSEQLSAEVLKHLKANAQEAFSSVVITVPAKFLAPQKEATLKAAQLAGFMQTEILPEPTAAALAYGLSSQKDGCWLVFDFGGGTFDAALMRYDEGFIKPIDTEGDNWLGGKNLDEAVIDEALMPYLRQNYSIESYFTDTTKNKRLKDAFKKVAQMLRIELTTRESAEFVSELDDYQLVDDQNNEISLDFNFTLTRERLNEILRPHFQKAINITENMLSRNGIKPGDLTSVLLVGGPTRTPLLRSMLADQLKTKVETDIDPMTAVAQGAAIYAATIPLQSHVEAIEQPTDILKIEMKYDTTSMEETALVNISAPSLDEKTNYTCRLRHSKGTWTSHSFELKAKPQLQKVSLIAEGINTYTLDVYDEAQNLISVFPKEINIIRGLSGTKSTGTLSYNICIATYYDDEKSDLITTFKNLVKNTQLPAMQEKSGLRTRDLVRKGTPDQVRIPIYQGEYIADRSPLQCHHHIADIIVSGQHLPSDLPKGSPIDLTLRIDTSERISAKVYFPSISHSEEFAFEIKNVAVPSQENLIKEAQEIKTVLQHLNSTPPDIESEMSEIMTILNAGNMTSDTALQTFSNFKRIRLKIWEHQQIESWPMLEKELRDALLNTDELINDSEKHLSEVDFKSLTNELSEIRGNLAIAIGKKDKSLCMICKENVLELSFRTIHMVLGDEVIHLRLKSLQEQFNKTRWRDSAKARLLINKGLQLYASSDVQGARNTLSQISDLIIDDHTGDTTR